MEEKKRQKHGLIPVCACVCVLINAESEWYSKIYIESITAVATKRE